jgi:hypothetical protein
LFLTDTDAGLSKEIELKLRGVRVTTGHPSVAARLWHILPPTRWLAEYKREWLQGDVVAAITLAAYAIPVSLA